VSNGTRDSWLSCNRRTWLVGTFDAPQRPATHVTQGIDIARPSVLQRYPAGGDGVDYAADQDGRLADAGPDLDREGAI
jgi:hypothetical protein